MAAQKNKIIILLGITLVIVIGVSVGVVIFLPSGGSSQSSESVVSSTPGKSTGITANETEVKFDLSVFQTAAYQLLNIQPVQDGSLPVQPPATTGKTNPFL